MKKFLLLPLLPFLIYITNVLAAEPEGISAKSAVLMDAASGRLLFEKNGYERLAMASTTKIMTAVVAVESCSDDEIVTVSPNAFGVEGSSLWLEIGEKLTVRQLLLGLMLKSGNDAAVALAEHTAGSVESFVLLMNAKAREIGMKNTHFETPNGLDSDNHYTTAYDMALLGRYAMKNPRIREIVGTKTASVPWAGKEWDRGLKNHNKLLWQLEGCTGIKTGFTKKSGRCLVSSVKRDGRELICVSLNAPDDWNDHKRLYDYGFSEFETVTPAEKGKKHSEITVNEAVVELRYAENFPVSLRAEEKSLIERRTEIYKTEPPITKGEIIGREFFFCGGELLGGVDLEASKGVKKPLTLKDYIRIASENLV